MAVRCSHIVLAAVLAGFSAAEALAQSDEPPIVAFPRVVGPKAAGRGPLAKGVVAAFEKSGFEVLRREPLQAAADELGASVYDLEVARVAACDYLATVRVQRKGRRFVAQGNVVSTEDGKTIVQIERRYKGKRGARSAGLRLGERMVEGILEDRAPAPIAQVPPAPAPRALPVPASPPPRSAPEPSLPAGDDPSPRAEPEARALDPVDEPFSGPSSGETAATESLAVEPSEAPRTPERRIIRASLGGGSRVYTAYSVAVADQVTGLSYSLVPLIGMEAHVAVAIPKTPIGVEADFRLIPVRFSVESDPPVTPPDPSGQFIELGGAIWWLFDVGLAPATLLTFRPMLAIEYGTMSVEDQGQNTIITSWETVSVGGGLRVGLELGRTVGLDIEGRGAPILSFGEFPATTGENGGGFQLGGRARGRYWFMDMAAAQLSAGYTYRSLGTEGQGTRATFDGDPPLVDADVQTEAIDIMLGVVLAL